MASAFSSCYLGCPASNGDASEQAYRPAMAAPGLIKLGPWPIGQTLTALAKRLPAARGFLWISFRSLAIGLIPVTFLLLLAQAACALALQGPGSEGESPATPIQVIDGHVTRPGVQLYRVASLNKGQTLSIRVRTLSGHLDPLVALLQPQARLDELEPGPLRNLIAKLSRDQHPIDVSRTVWDRYALAWNDDYEGHYYAALRTEIPADGDYWLAVGSSLVRPSLGAYRLVVGIDSPTVLTGRESSTGPAFVFADQETGVVAGAIASVSDELKTDQPRRFYHLAEMAAGQTFYAHARALDGDLRPVLTLYDQTDKPVAYGNFAATDEEASLRYELPRKASGFRLRIATDGSAELATAGRYRLLMGLNAPEVLRGKGEPTGRDMLREPIPVQIGVKLQQITEVDQRAENFGVVASLAMRWKDPALAFDPETAEDRFQVFSGDAFGAEMSRRGLLWPQYTIANQQGNRWVQNRVVAVRPDGEAIYLERFSTTLQAPLFDFRDFPFDEQDFFIRVELIAPEWIFRFEEAEGYSEVGEKLGEEEWVVLSSDTSVTTGSILQNPVSRFNFEFEAKRHIDYYVFRILFPLGVIIGVSWVLFFLKDYAKRVDAAGANLLLFIAFNFAISNDLPRLGYLTFLDTVLISAFLVTAVVLILSVYLRRRDMQGRQRFVASVDRYVIILYPLAYLLTIGLVTLLFQ